MAVPFSTTNVSRLHPACFARTHVTLFFIVPPKTLERGMDRHNAAIDRAGKMLFDLFKSGIWMGSDKRIELLQVCTGKIRPCVPDFEVAAKCRLCLFSVAKACESRRLRH